MVLTKSGSDHTGSWIGSEKKKLKTVLKRKTINKKIQEKNHLALLGMAGLCTLAFMGHTVATWRGRLIVTAWLCSQFAISATCVYLSSGWDGGRCLKIIGSPRPPPSTLFAVPFALARIDLGELGGCSSQSGSEYSARGSKLGSTIPEAPFPSPSIGWF